jgi:hypothetical protein
MGRKPFFVYPWACNEIEFTITASFIDLLFQPWMIDGDDSGAISGMNEWQGKPTYWEET